MLTKEPIYQIKRYLCNIERETVGNRIYRGLQKTAKRGFQIGNDSTGLRIYDADQFSF